MCFCNLLFYVYTYLAILHFCIYTFPCMLVFSIFVGTFCIFDILILFSFDDLVTYSLTSRQHICCIYSHVHPENANPRVRLSSVQPAPGPKWSQHCIIQPQIVALGGMGHKRLKCRINVHALVGT